MITTYKSSDAKDTMYGTSFIQGPNPTSTQLHVGGFGDTYRTFIQFDFTGAPPASSIISAVLQVVLASGAAGNPLPQVKGVTSTWDPSTLSSTVLPTWDSSVSGTFSWTNTAGALETCDITQLVKDWINGARTNFGLVIEPTVNSGSNTDSSIQGRRNGDATLNPVILITYNAVDLPFFQEMNIPVHYADHRQVRI